ncbi:hypothetical protein [Thalassomonas actiniarum]|uniref:Uncharacterized protein n=1 Tax=Thalassomonas actiniarum TaxID=485447 RepID=A0AAF0C2Z5_9GAMM|nr:hypothetical protein [Thalassomonas actiniarum]WDD98365.1 hypothetical protein SG35_024355 [Thalassomonas actiniarum]
MFIWNEKLNAVDLDGVLQLTHPDSGISWANEADALRWWQTSEFNPENTAKGSRKPSSMHGASEPEKGSSLTARLMAKVGLSKSG